MLLRDEIDEQSAVHHLLFPLRARRYEIAQYHRMRSIERASYASVESTRAKGPAFRVEVTDVTPKRLRNCSAGTVIGPGLGAVPGAGCGNAVDMAV